MSEAPLMPNACAELLLLCARVTRSAADKERLRRLLNEPRDWTAFFKSALDGGVSMLAYRALKEHGDSVPAGTIDLLRRCYYQSAARYLRIRQALRPVVEELERRGLRFAFTKGIRLAELVYGDFALRAFEDVDLAARPGDGPAIEAALAEMGFTTGAVETAGTNAGAREKGASAARPAPVPEAGLAHSPHYRKGDLLVEVHYDALGLQIPLVDGKEVWDGVGTVDLEGWRLPVFSIEHELCHLCLHVMEHSYARLVWLTDIAEVAGGARGGEGEGPTGKGLERKGPDWNRVAAICLKEGIGTPVYYSLYLAERLWPGTLPREALERLRPGRALRAACNMFWPAQKIRARKPLVTFPYFLPSFFALVGRRDLGGAVRMIGRTVFPPRSWVAHYYRIEAGSLRGALRLAGHYAWRALRPFAVVARRLLHLE